MGNFVKLFLEGLVSFFSPCILPLLPVYFGYLAGNGDEKNSRLKTFILTIGFCLGISTAFLILGLGASVLHSFFIKNSALLSVIFGVILIFASLVSFGIIKIPVNMGKISNLKPEMKNGATFIKSYLLGLFLSVAWTPCIGPMLANALFQASSADSYLTGWLYIGAYILGFITMFLIAGLFTNEILNWIKKHKDIVKYTEKLAGIIILVTGIYMVYNGFKINTERAGNNSVQQVENIQSESYSKPENEKDTEVIEKEEELPEEKTYYIEDINFRLKDINDVEHSLIDYKGKVIIVDFSTTWCTYCKYMTPTLVNIQKKYSDDVQVIVINPLLEERISKEEVAKYYDDNYGINYPLLFDEDGITSYGYGVAGFPSLYFFEPGGKFAGYYPGMATQETLEQIIDKLKETQVK